jgi:hypothetical protein
MHLRRISIDNVRSIRELEWEFEAGKEAGWHVVLGNNATGKTAVLQAIAYAVINKDWPGQAPHRWVRRGAERLRIEVSFVDGWMMAAQFGPDLLPAFPQVALPQEYRDEQWKAHEQRYISYFSCGLGSMRRFGPRSYGDKNQDESPRYARHRTLFKQEAVLTEALDWLQDLEFRAVKAREAKNPDHAERLLANIRRFVNETNLLPYKAKLGDITPDAVEFIDGNGVQLAIEELSDGYRSILGIAFELIRRLAEHFGSDAIWSTDELPKVAAAGVVLIDEIDVHLHPSWQREIGYWFTEWFPNLQFIVTTHSPLICHAAERGSILRLPDPGSDDLPRVVTGLERDHLVYGNVLDAYATESFGYVPTRSRAGKEKLAILARLNQKYIREGLDDIELEERERLLRMLPTGSLQDHDAAE